MRICFATTIAGFPITLAQTSKQRFSVAYGRQIDEKLTYPQAAAKLGEAIMHASACAGLLDNSGVR